MPNPYTAYTRHAVSTMTPIEVIIKMYDECEKHLNRAIHFIDKKDYANAHASLDRTGMLVNALRSVLDMDAGEISANLDSLYDFFYKQIVFADMKKDTATIRSLLPQISELRSAFVQISKLPKGGTAGFNGEAI